MGAQTAPDLRPSPQNSALVKMENQALDGAKRGESAQGSVQPGAKLHQKWALPRRLVSGISGINPSNPLGESTDSPFSIAEALQDGLCCSLRALWSLFDREGEG